MNWRSLSKFLGRVSEDDLEDCVAPVLSDGEWRVMRMRERLRRMRRTRLTGVTMDDDIGELP